MARPRAFDTENAIEKAMQVFWQHGYEDASLPDLLEGMGLTRGSLYKAFTDKKTLFLLVLDRYETAAVDAGVALLTDPAQGDGRDRIRAMFGSVLAARSRGDHRGCLLCTAAAGPAVRDPEIGQAVHRALAKLQGGIAVALAQATDLPRLTETGRARLTDVLLTQYVGLRLLARSQLPLGIVEHAVTGIDDILDGAAARLKN